MSGSESSSELADQLASLKLQRDPPGGGNGGLIAGGVALCIVVAGAAAVYLLRDRFTTKTAETTPVLLVQPGQEAPLFVATGTVTAPVTSTLAPRSPGRLLHMLVQEGDVIAADQPVAVLDTTDLKLALMQAKADIASAEAKVAASQATAKTAEVKQARADKLLKTGAGTESAAQDASLDVDSTRAQLQVAAADLGLARVRLATAEQNLESATLRAPFHGVVLRVLAEPGDFIVTAASQGVVRLANLADLEVDAEVAESNLGKLTEHMPVEVRLDVQPNQGLVGSVFSIRPNVDPAKATAIAKVRLADRPGAAKLALYPGMNGRVNFLAKEPEAAALQKAPQLEVPATALVHEGDTTQIYTVDKEGVVHASTVTLGGTDGGRVVLKDGPPAGTLIISNPTDIKPGDRIALPNT